jgi:hypothetical protein
MPYPTERAHQVTRPDTALEFRNNGLPGFVGNAHTARVTSNDLAGFPQEPYASYWPSTWTPVTFDGNDRLRNATTLGLASATYDTFTFALAFQVNVAPGSSQTIIEAPHSGGNFVVALNPDRTIEVTYQDDSAQTAGFVYSSAGRFDIGVAYVLHVAAKASTNELFVFLNGEPLPAATVGWASLTPTNPFPRPTAFAIGGTASTTEFIGTLGLVWWHPGVFYTNPSAFYRPYDLGAQLANPGVRPTVGFGGVQTQTNWDAGTNLGSGTGTWTLTGDIA